MRKIKLFTLITALLCVVSSWGTAYNAGTISLRDLQVGDILMPGVTVSFVANDYLCMAGDHVELNGYVMPDAECTDITEPTKTVEANGVITFLETNHYYPIVATSPKTYGNAWEVTSSALQDFTTDCYCRPYEVILLGTTYNGPGENASPVVATIDKGYDDVEYTSLAEAFAACSEYETVTLVADARVSSTITLDSKGYITLDLNGHGVKYTGNAGSIFEITNTELTIQDGTPSAAHKYYVSGPASNGAGLAYVDDSRESEYQSLTGGYITGGKGKTMYVDYTNYTCGGAFLIGQNGKVHLQGGTLLGNQSQLGGAVFVYDDEAVFTMENGKIMNNYASQYGGGIALYGHRAYPDESYFEPKVILSGGKIMYNYASTEAGGIYTKETDGTEVKIQMQGSPEIKENIALPDDQEVASNIYIHSGYVAIDLTGELDPDHQYYDPYEGKVGITMSEGATNEVFTNNYVYYSGGNYSYDYETGTYEGFFFSDKPNRGIGHPTNQHVDELCMNPQKITPVVTPPTVIPSLEYNDMSLALIYAGSTNGGTLVYRLGTSGDWSAYIPMATNAGTYYVYYKVIGNEEYSDWGGEYGQPIVSTIAKANSSISSVPTAPANDLMYTGSAQSLLGTSGSAVGGTMQYKVNSGSWGNSANATDAGTYTVSYKVKGDNNHNDYTPSGNSFVVRIAAPSVDEDDDNIASFISSRSGQTTPLTIYRTLYKDGYFNTLCLPFDLNEEQIAASELAGCKLYVFSEAEVETDEETGDRILRQVVTPTNAIEAGVPYLISWANTGEVIEELNFSSVTVENTTGSEVGVENGVRFIGHIAKQHISDDANHSNLFVGEQNTLYWPIANDSYMRGFRAYFNVPTDGPKGAPMFKGMPAKIVLRENTATGISNVQGGNVQSTKVLRDGQLIIIRNGIEYNANGQMVK